MIEQRDQRRHGEPDIGEVPASLQRSEDVERPTRCGGCDPSGERHVVTLTRADHRERPHDRDVATLGTPAVAPVLGTHLRQRVATARGQHVVLS